jgi:protoheme ferro-lyase
VDKIRLFHNHPGFVEAVADRLQHALAKIPENRREAAHLIYTAHSIPVAMAQGCDYEKQLKETGRLVAENWDAESGGWCTRAEVVQRRNLGWSRTFLIACAKSKREEAVQM